MNRRWRRSCKFGPGKRRKLDAAARARRIGWAFKALRGGLLRPLEHMAYAFLLRRVGPDGECFPSHATIAAEIGASVRSVQRAMEKLRRIGALWWEHRMVRDGWQAHQTSNAYVIPEPPQAISPPHDGQVGGGIIEERKKKAIQVVAEQASRVAQALATGWKGGQQQAAAALATIQHRMEQRLRNVARLNSATGGVT